MHEQDGEAGGRWVGGFEAESRMLCSKRKREEKNVKSTGFYKMGHTWCLIGKNCLFPGSPAFLGIEILEEALPFVITPLTQFGKYTLGSISRPPLVVPGVEAFNGVFWRGHRSKTDFVKIGYGLGVFVPSVIL